LTNESAPHPEVLLRERQTASPLEQQPVHPIEPQVDSVQRTLNRGASALADRQAEDGHWLFELEADATIPSEYMFLHYFMRTVDKDREARIAVYLRRRQHDNGSWSLYEAGPGDLSATVKAYFAL